MKPIQADKEIPTFDYCILWFVRFNILFWNSLKDKYCQSNC